MKNKKLIDLYKEWMETGLIEEDRFRKHGTGGLCNCVPEKYLETLFLFTPKKDSDGFWANNLDRTYYSTIESMYGFNPLRQTIVLLICAIHNEL